MLTIGLQHKSKEPFYEQIYRYIKNEILIGSLLPNTKLPSSRGLATHLGVSRNTVDMAYAQLVSEGYIESQPKKGYYVCEIEHMHYTVPLENDNLDTTGQETIDYQYDFNPNGVDMVNFPYNRWRKLMKSAMMENNSDLFQTGHPQGDLELRQAIRLYLHHSRGVNCHEEQIILGAGSDYLLLLLGRLFEQDRVIALEEPTYLQAYYIFQELGYDIKPLTLDESGMDMNALHQSGADIAYVTPSHQYPTGVVMPIKRRLELLSWANNEPGRYIIEDDYDSEFRYSGKPIPSLQGNDTYGNVIYIGTFSKAIAPAIRISYMVLPNLLLKKFKEKLWFYSCTVSRIDQRVIARFMIEGHYERHLNRMRGIYKAKHDYLVKELRKFGQAITILGESAGLHLLIQYNYKLTEQELVHRAANQDVRIYPLSSYFTKKQKDQKPVIILGFARLTDSQIKNGIDQLRQAWTE